MVESWKKLSRILMYLLAVCRNSSGQYDQLNCTEYPQNSRAAFCRSKSNSNSVIPRNTVVDSDQYFESLTINTTGNGSLAITRLDVFKFFVKLRNLDIQLGRSFHIDKNLLDSVPIHYLQKELFNVSTLKSLSLKYNEFNDKNYSWIVHDHLETLYLSNGVMEFDVHDCYFLNSVRLSNNKLSKIPSFHYPASKLKKLDLRNNPMDEFSLNDLAILCYLEYFAMDTSEIANCECYKLKLWVQELEKLKNFTFDGDLNCNDTVAFHFNCTLDEAKQKRLDCLNKWNTPKGDVTTRVLQGVIAFIIGSLPWCCICGLCCLCLYRTDRTQRVPYWQSNPYQRYPPYPQYPRYPETTKKQRNTRTTQNTTTDQTTTNSPTGVI